MTFDTLEEELLEAIGGSESVRPVRTLIELGANPDTIVKLDQISHGGSSRLTTCRIVAIENILYSRDQKEFKYEESVYILNLPIKDDRFLKIIYQAFDNPNYSNMVQFDVARQICNLFNAPLFFDKDYDSWAEDDKHDYAISYTHYHEEVYGTITV